MHGLVQGCSLHSHALAACTQLLRPPPPPARSRPAPARSSRSANCERRRAVRRALSERETPVAVSSMGGLGFTHNSQHRQSHRHDRETRHTYTHTHTHETKLRRAQVTALRERGPQGLLPAPVAIYTAKRPLLRPAQPLLPLSLSTSPRAQPARPGRPPERGARARPRHAPPRATPAGAPGIPCAARRSRSARSAARRSRPVVRAKVRVRLEP